MVMGKTVTCRLSLTHSPSLDKTHIQEKLGLTEHESK